MEHKKEDLRIRRTHKLLTDALFSLLETTGFDDLSVVDICDRAMVHRATFYKHFKDKYDFLEYATKEKLREFYEESIKQKDYTDTNEIYRSIINHVLDFVDDNKQMFKLSGASAGSSFLDYINKIISEELLAFIKMTGGDSCMSVPPEMAVNFLTGGFTSLVCWWLANDSKYTKDEMEIYIGKMFSPKQIDN